MNDALGFWIASSAVLLLLACVFFAQGHYRKNAFFAWWLIIGVSMQGVSAYAMLLGFPAWLYRLWPAADWLSYGLAAAALAVAFSRRSCAVNGILLYGLGAMMTFSVGVRWLGAGLGQNIESWLLNIAFLGPAVFLLMAFSNIRADRLPLHIDTWFRGCDRDAADAAMARQGL